MTKQETFKRRVRERMAKTSERYNAARRSLIEKSEARARPWVSEPEHSEETIQEATGKGWDEWRDLLDDWPGHADGHTAIATHVHEEYDIDGWWSQAVTVGYERITGLRLPYQQPDGTFSAGKSRTVTADPEELRKMLIDDIDRADLFPGFDTELRSRPTSKVLRVAIGPGVAQFAIDSQPDGRVKVSIQHERLPSPMEVESWKAYWSDWLEAIDLG
jgi:hypothetical protein